jgi:hypothetical protein
MTLIIGAHYFEEQAPAVGATELQFSQLISTNWGGETTSIKMNWNAYENCFPYGVKRPWRQQKSLLRKYLGI